MYVAESSSSLLPNFGVMETGTQGKPLGLNHSVDWYEDTQSLLLKSWCSFTKSFLAYIKNRHHYLLFCLKLNCRENLHT